MSKTKSTAKANFEKTTRESALEVANKLESAIQDYCEKIIVAGSIRQGKEMVGDVDIVIIPKTPVDEFIEKIKETIEFEYGGTKKLFGLFMGRPVNIFITTAESYGACLYQSTGPAMYNIHKRRLAKSKGFKLNEYGLFNRDTDERVAGATEESIFEALGWKYKEPTERKSPEWVKKPENLLL
jgi:DNA polymerase (family 10)